MRRNGAEGGRTLFSRGHLHRLLSNPLYRGEVSRKGKRYPGQHEALIDAESWDRVQEMLEENRQGHQRRETAEHTSLLKGLLYDDAGEQYAPSHTTRAGRRYRYYELRRPTGSGDRQHSERLPAGQIESVVRQSIEESLTLPGLLKNAVRVDLSARQLKHIVHQAKVLRCRLAGLNDRDWRHEIAYLLQKVVIHANRLSLHISPSALMRRISDVEPDAASLAFPETWKLDVQCALVQRGEQLGVIVETAKGKPNPDAALISLLKRACDWRIRAEDEVGAPMEKLAKEQGVTPSYFGRIVRLA